MMYALPFVNIFTRVPRVKRTLEYIGCGSEPGGLVYEGEPGRPAVWVL